MIQYISKILKLRMDPDYQSWQKRRCLDKNFYCCSFHHILLGVLFMIINPTLNPAFILGLVQVVVSIGVTLSLKYLILAEKLAVTLLQCYYTISIMIIQVVTLGLQRSTASNIIYGMLLVEGVNQVPTYTFKLIPFLSEVIIWFIFKGNEEIISGLCLMVIQLAITIGYEEFQYCKYKRYQILFSIVNSLPNAFCMLDSQKQLIYQNEAFQKLSINLNQPISSIRLNQKPEENRQVRLLNNLQYDEIQTNASPMNGIVQLDDDEIYKIRKVSFQKSSPEKPNHLEIESTQTTNMKSLTMAEKIFSESIFFKEKIFGLSTQEKRKFKSDVYLKLEVNHQADDVLQSAIKKRRKSSVNKIMIKKSSSNTPPISFNGIPNQVSPPLLANQRINETIPPKFDLDRYRDSNEKIQGKQTIHKPQNLDIHGNGGQQPSNQDCGAFFNHKLKLLVDHMHCFDDQDSLNTEQFHLYFISDLTPLMLKNKANSLDKVKQNILRSITHDFVTYLNGAYGYLQQANKELEEQGNKDFEVKMLMGQASKYLTLQIYKVKDFEDFIAIQDNKFTLTNERLNLNSICEECIELIKDQVIKKKLQVSFEVPDQIFWIISDRQRMFQMLLNLLSNAIRFTYRGGITLKVDFKVNSWLNEQFEEEICLDELIEVIVQDSGEGLTDQELGMLAKKLLIKDDHEKVSKDSVGMGMGLAVCKHILRLTGPESLNHLFVTSKKGLGSIFYFYLKYCKVQGQPVGGSQLQDIQLFTKRLPTIQEVSSGQCLNIIDVEGPAAKVYSQNKISNKYQPKQLTLNIQVNTNKEQEKINLGCNCNQILIVDDEQFNLDVLQYIIKPMGFNFSVAYNGKQALERIDERFKQRCGNYCQLYKCILMDINMPILDGIDTIRRIRQLESTEWKLPLPILVFAVTGFSSPTDKEQCLLNGFNFVINKPASRKVLSQVFMDWKIPFLDNKEMEQKKQI